ncbi:MAG TPA: class I SAM-dependent methyltransferase [Acidimicrobiales bacterium]|nr:class I SAM-dependent methyltransferase [Acidimicrobiales bacterium]
MTSPARDLAAAFYEHLRKEVLGGNPALSPSESAALRAFYGRMEQSSHVPPALAGQIYVDRRAPVIATVLGKSSARVLDAGCGYGSESFLLASSGARVLAVDRSPRQVEIAEKRLPYFERLLGRTLEVSFEVADLEGYAPPSPDLDLTWLGSVLAAISDQQSLVDRVYEASKTGGHIAVSDMNLRNPLFLYRESRRRRRARNTEFTREGNFLKMLRRQDRLGARYYGTRGGAPFDDVQFFTPATLSRVLASAGFRPLSPEFSGLAPPQLGRMAAALEPDLRRLPGVRSLAYFYLLMGVK